MASPLYELDLNVAYGLGFFAVLPVAAYALRMLFVGRARVARVDRQDSSAFLSPEMMETFFWALRPVEAIFTRLGISANALTWLSLALATLAGGCLALGYFGFGTTIAVMAAFLDLLDGAVARRLGQVSAAGAILDTSIDRYVEFVVLSGLILFYAPFPALQAVGLLALVGSLMVSYSSALAEIHQVKLPPSPMRRVERWIYLLFGTGVSVLSVRFWEPLDRPRLAYPAAASLLFIAAMTNTVAVRRLRLIAKALCRREREIAGVLLFCALFACRGLSAYSSPNVPITDPAYRDIDKLIGAGLVRSAVYSQRPWSREEFARLVAEAIANRAERGKKKEVETGPADGSYIGSVLARLRNEYREELAIAAAPGEARYDRVRVLERAEAEYLYLRSPSRPVPYSNGLGDVEADVNPLTAFRDGAPLATGSNVILQTSHWLTYSQFLSFYFQPRLALFPSGPEFAANRLFGKLAFDNFEIELGNDSLIWGQGETGGLLYSNNASPFTLLKLSSVSPFHLPWIFHGLGPTRFTFFASRLGADRTPANPFMYGMRLSILPWDGVELSFQHGIFIGGRGFPLPWWGPFEQLVPIFGGAQTGLSNNVVADHRAGIDARIRLPWLLNSELYLEQLFEDMFKESFAANFRDWMSFMAGIYLPVLGAGGASDLRLEFRRIPPAVYRHGEYTTGYTLKRRFFQDELGTDGTSLELTYRTDLEPDKQLLLKAAFEVRHGDQYDTTKSKRGNSNIVFPITNFPTEARYRLTAGMVWRLSPSTTLSPSVAYERANNFGFVAGVTSDNVLIGTKLTWSDVD